MRSLRLWLLAAVVAAPLCAAEPVAAPAVAPPASLTRPAVRPMNDVDLARAYVAAWNEHDAEKAAGFVDERVAYYDASTPGRQVGKAAAKKNVVEAFMKMAPDCVWKMTSAPISSPSGVAFEWEFSGTNSGDLKDGTKATGKKFSFKERPCCGCATTRSSIRPTTTTPTRF